MTRLAGTPQAVTTNLTYETPGTGFNRLTGLTTPTATTTMAYDDPSRQITVTDPLTHQTVITYNSRGQMLTITDPLSHTTTSEYDSQGNLPPRKNLPAIARSGGKTPWEGYGTKPTHKGERRCLPTTAGNH